MTSQPRFAQYISPVDASGLGASYGRGQPVVSYAQSFETAVGSTPPSYANVSSQRPPGVAGYQMQTPVQLRPMGLNSAGSLHQVSGPFPFVATPVAPAAALDSVAEGAPAIHGMPDSRAAAYSSMPAAPQNPSASAGMPQGQSDARATSMYVGDRAAFRDQMIKTSFQFVDAAGLGKINMHQNKTGLTLVFDKLGEGKSLKDEWFVKVFRNYDKDNVGLISFNDFRDIVVQMDDHKMKKKGELMASAAAAASTPVENKPLPPPPPVEGAQAGGVSPTPAAAVVPGMERSTLESCEYASVMEGGDRNSVSERNLTHKASAASQSSSKTRVGAAEIKPDVMYPTYVGRLAIFDDYEFHGDVGHGAFGKVQVVQHRATKQLRAVKVMAGQTALQRELIETEIELLKTLNHPNIMKLHEVYTEEGPEKRVTNGNVYVICELCEGGDLFARIIHHYQRLNQPMTEGHVAYMMQQILSALAYCHDKDIIHRDIKPENILFVDRTSQSAIKIIDYGLANFAEKIRGTAKEVKVEKKGLTGQIVRMLPTYNGKHIIPHHDRVKVMQRAGTPHYMAPEMIAGDYDHKADIFSVGIIFCQLLTGWHPFYIPQVDDEASVRKKISDPEPVKFPSDIFTNVTPEAQELCAKLLEKDPKKRFSAKEALSHAWFQAKPSTYGVKDDLSLSLFDGLMKYQAYNKLKRAVLQLLTRELSEYQIQELRKKFNALDTKGDGLLSREELIEGMRHVGYEFKEEELSKILAALDGTEEGIGYKEFISALIERRHKFGRPELLECFKKFDTNNTGKISYDDVCKVLQSRQGGSPGITESEWAEIAVGTPDGNRTAEGKVEVTFEEFVTLMEAET